MKTLASTTPKVIPEIHPKMFINILLYNTIFTNTGTQPSDLRTHMASTGLSQSFRWKPGHAPCSGDPA